MGGEIFLPYDASGFPLLRGRPMPQDFDVPDDRLISAESETRIRQHLVLVALGKRSADRALRVGRLFDVHTRSWREDQEIIISGHRIAYVGAETTGD